MALNKFEDDYVPRAMLDALDARTLKTANFT